MHASSVYLNSEQIDKLRCVLTPSIEICPTPSTSSFPILNIKPKDFLREVLIKLKQQNIQISSIHLHGGAASYVLMNDSDYLYRDIDILFYVKTPLSSEQQTTLFSSNNQPYLCDVWTIIKYVVSSCLIEYLPNITSYTPYFISSVLETYTKKSIQISSDQDSWALLSLQNRLGQNLELKFVENLKRQWQFSVDSFQIDVKPILFEKTSIQSITTKIFTKSLNIGAVNGLNILDKDQTKGQNVQPGQIEFGFFTPSSSPNVIPIYDNNQYQTLATITTIERSMNNLRTSQFRSRSPKPSQSTTDEDDQSESNIRFQISMNEDIDDGIEVDVGDSTNEDDDQQFRTPIETTENNFNDDTSSIFQIQVNSFYKDLHEALRHLNERLIATYEPETIRGGGLLKYCDLLARHYKLYDEIIMTHMQRYMCSRFFIDYKTLREQLHNIIQYIGTHYLPSPITTNFCTINSPIETSHIHYYIAGHLMHFQYESNPINQVDLPNAKICLEFLENLMNVIRHSTVCLTHEDRELLLYNIYLLHQAYHAKYECLLQNDNQHIQKYHSSNYNPCYPSTNSSRSSSPSSLSSKSHGNYRSYHQRNYRHQTNNSYNQTRTYSNSQSNYRSKPS